jgi:peptidoglycan/LPS O-acetylase OafA/YrhL
MSSSTTAASSSRTGGGFRPDIQGLRALAVGIVMIDHAGFTTLAGGYVGVDVFFVISGFLITTLLLREAQRDQRISLAGFYGRRARRILPAASVVLVATVLGSLVVLPLLRALEVVKDATWASFFAANVRFSSVATDYFAQGQGQSPLQHYWSLAVEEQYYLVWPLVLLGCVWLAHRRRSTRIWWLVLATIVLLSAASLAYSVWFTYDDPTAAYFSTAARGWELGAGSAVAVVLSRRSWALPRIVTEALSWVGLAAIAMAALTFTAHTQVPGYAIALPITGAVLLIVSGAGGPSTVRRLLSLRPAQVVGDWSYSLYLWHWPVLVLAQAHWHRRPLPHLTLLALLVLTFALSAATYRWVETPFRRGFTWRRPSRALLLYPATLALVLGVAGIGRGYVDHELGGGGHNPAITLSDFKGHHLSAKPKIALVEASVLAAQHHWAVPSRPTPSLLGIRQDTAPLGDCDYRSGTTRLCPGGDPSASRSIVVLGDSHARAWSPALEEIGRRAGYRVYTLVYSGCSVSAYDQVDHATGRPWDACQAFKHWAMTVIADLHPDYVVVSSRGASPVVLPDGSRVGRQDGELTAYLAATRRGVGQALRQLAADAGHVVVIGDTPLLPREPGVCLSTRGGVDLDDCLFHRSTRAHRVQMAFRAAARDQGARFVSAMPWFCHGGMCPSVVGGMITLRDKEHVTPEYATYLAMTLAGRMGVVDATDGRTPDGGRSR